ncbi:NCS2 family permease, partial [Helicobacter pylori]
MGFFKLKEHNTNIATEFRAGLTTFITMIYIVPLNALILSQANMPYEALLSATAIITILSSVFNGLWANTPIAMSVGLGLSAYFSFGLVQGLKLPWQSALGIVALSGAIFVILSF